MASRKQSRQRSAPPPRNIPRWVLLTGLGIVSACLAISLVGADWYYALPADTPVHFVGRQSCIECHADEHEAWTGSHHDLAMDTATELSVLGDFNDATLEHFGITSRMFRRDGKYMIHTEGPDGTMADFEIQYVFGVDPLQQYMVELEPPTPGQGEEAIGRLQVLRVSWDTHKKEWFYLSPPDVKEKLAIDDPLHWTGRTQNWNHFCADCHSTNVQKNHDLATNTFHTTFSEIDVSCETCHGPGSVHVKLANAPSLFWDRNLGYGLKKLKGEGKEAQLAQVESCAACHSRRQTVCPDYQLGDGYYDQYNNELLMPHTYYCDGQIMDEDYVYGSFIQSKMFHQGIRCTDCHDPHTTKLKFEGNKLCTSCHQHPAGKYDTPAHHFHPTGSTGASCVECHMPETTYMEVDPRRDHSLRVPRPDLSVELGTPNACTKCHLEKADLPTEEHPDVKRYDQWMALARAGDEKVLAGLKQADQWALDAVKKWYGDTSKIPPEKHFAHTLAKAWNNDPTAEDALLKLVRDQKQAGIVRASALTYLRNYLSEDSVRLALRQMADDDPQMRIAAIQMLQDMQILSANVRGQVLDALLGRLEDDERAVRTEAAWALAGQNTDAVHLRGKTAAYERALQERIDTLQRDSDQPSAHLSLGVLYERIGDIAKAENAYRTAIRLGPEFTGPRSNLVSLLEQRQEQEEQQMRQLVMGGNRPAAEAMTSGLAERAVEISKLRMEELRNLKRDVGQQPDFAPLQYQYAITLYTVGKSASPEAAQAFFDDAFQAFQKAKRLQPNNVQYATMYTVMCQFLERWELADAAIEDLLELEPNNPGFLELKKQIDARVNSQR